MNTAQPHWNLFDGGVHSTVFSCLFRSYYNHCNDLADALQGQQGRDSALLCSAWSMEVISNDRRIRAWIGNLGITPEKCGRIDDYFLRGMVYVELDSGKTVRLTGSTSNASRSGGGTSYYCIESSNINILCRTVDDQIAREIMKIQVDPDLIPLIRDSYTDEIGDKLGQMRPDKRADLEHKLKEVDDEEARALRLYTMGKISERVWDNMWTEFRIAGVRSDMHSNQLRLKMIFMLEILTLHSPLFQKWVYYIIN